MDITFDKKSIVGTASIFAKDRGSEKVYVYFEKHIKTYENRNQVEIVSA